MTATTPPPSSRVPAGPATRLPRLVARLPRLVDLGAWLLAFIWAAPLLYAVWTAFHPGAYATRFDLTAPLTLDNFRAAWEAAPFPRYMLNTVMLVTGTLAAQLVIGTLAAAADAVCERLARGWATRACKWEATHQPQQNSLSRNSYGVICR